MSSRALSVDESSVAVSADDAGPPASTPALTASMADTVIVAEFSEHEGPVPLETFPPTPAYFDLNGFVVRTLSADYQRASDPASTADDSQVVFRVPIELPDKAVGDETHLTAYVHHFTLYDVHARGYVRPVCMSFVTLDPDKVMDNFAEIHAEFSRVSSLLKTANQLVFLSDLQQRLADLRFTRDSIRAADNGGAAAREGFSEDKFVAAADNVNSMLVRLRAAIDLRVASDRRLAALFTREVVARHDRASAPPRALRSLHKIASFETSLRSLAELCQLSYARAIARLVHIQQRFSPPAFMLALQREEVAMAAAPASMVLAVGGVGITSFAAAGLLPGIAGSSSEALVAELVDELAGAEHRSDAASAEHTIVMADPTHAGSTDDDSFEDARSCCDASGQGSPSTLPLVAALTSPVPASKTTVARWMPSISLAAGNAANTGAAGASVAMPISPPGAAAPSGALLSVAAVAAAGSIGSANHSRPFISPFTSHPAPMTAAHVLSTLTGGSHEHETALAIELARVRRHPWARHLLFSLLKGRPVVVQADPAHARQVRLFVTALAVFVPGLGQLVHPWLARELRLVDLAEIRVCGLSKELPLSRIVRTHCTLVDWEADELTGPAYESGAYIDALLGGRVEWPDAASYLAHVHLTLLDMGLAALLHFFLCCVGTTPCWLEAGAELAWLDPSFHPLPASVTAATPSTRESPALVFAHMAVSGQDAEIVTYLTSVVRRQQVVLLQALRPELGFAAVPRTVRLDCSKLSTFRSPAKSRPKTS